MARHEIKDIIGRIDTDASNYDPGKEVRSLN